MSSGVSGADALSLHESGESTQFLHSISFTSAASRTVASAQHPCVPQFIPLTQQNPWCRMALPIPPTPSLPIQDLDKRLCNSRGSPMELLSATPLPGPGRVPGHGQPTLNQPHPVRSPSPSRCRQELQVCIPLPAPSMWHLVITPNSSVSKCMGASSSSSSQLSLGGWDLPLHRLLEQPLESLRAGTGPALSRVRNPRVATQIPRAHMGDLTEATLPLSSPSSSSSMGRPLKACRQRINTSSSLCIRCVLT